MVKSKWWRIMHSRSSINYQERRGILQYDIEASHSGFGKSLCGRLRMAANTSHLCVTASLPILSSRSLFPLLVLDLAVTCFDTLTSKPDTSRGLKSTCSLLILATLDSGDHVEIAQTSLLGRPHRGELKPQNCVLINGCCLKSLSWGSLLYSKVWLIQSLSIQTIWYDLPPLFKGGSSTVFISKLPCVGLPSKCFFKVQLLARTILKLLEHSSQMSRSDWIIIAC